MAPLPVLLVIFGPTGAGKSRLAEEVARQRSGEIISADAFAVYRGLDAGTAKPSPSLRREIRYHLIDVAEPDEHYSAGRWGREAREIAEDIARRGKLPVVCGGSGFYLSALLEGLPPGEAKDLRLREKLLRWAERRGAEAAHRFLAVNDPVAASRIPVRNLRYTLRALEILLLTGSLPSRRLGVSDAWAARWRVIKVGVRPSRKDLYARIDGRVRRMMEEGWDEEVRGFLGRGFSLETNAFQAIGYREIAGWVLGLAGKEETAEKVVAATRQLAKRQMTWFRRERDSVWVSPENALAETVARLDEAAKMEKSQ